MTEDGIMPAGTPGDAPPRPDDPALTYREARELARADDAGVRRRLAARADIAPEILYYLADDKDATVRRAIAVNPAAPRQADLLLVRDPDDAVRLDLARKIGRLAPDLPANGQDQLYKLTVEALGILARDSLVRVRAVIAEELKAVDSIPADIVIRLAHDVEIAVAGPVLEFSPLLGDDVLLEIINSDRVRGALSAISRRSGLAASVSDAIVATDDEHAIASLLSNPSAQIREETLDELISRAPGRDSWHRPLVQRPNLAPWAVGRIARVVSHSLLTTLARTQGLTEAQTRALADRVAARLSDDDGGAGTDGLDLDEASPEAPEPADPAQTEARSMLENGVIDLGRLRALIAAGDQSTLSCLLGMMAEIDTITVKRILRSGNAKGVMALAWRAGLDAEIGLLLQAEAAGIEAEALIHPDKDSGFPLSESDLDWRLQLFLE